MAHLNTAIYTLLTTSWWEEAQSVRRLKLCFIIVKNRPAIGSLAW